MPHWSIIKLNGTLGAHAAAWDALNQRQFQANPMLDSRFVDGLLRHFGDGSERLCVLQTDGEPQAMCLLRPKALGIWTTFLPAQAQIGPVLISDAQYVKSRFGGLPGTAPIHQVPTLGPTCWGLFGPTCKLGRPPKATNGLWADSIH